MDSCPKLGAFGHALSPLNGTSQNIHSFQKKKKKKKEEEEEEEEEEENFS